MDVINKYFDDLSKQQQEQLGALQELYLHWNNQINVISRKDIEHLYEKHVLHSLAIATQFNFTPQHKIMDLGCGGGFPGIPLAIFFPDTPFLLVDSIQKKLKVVQEIAQAIGLKNITTLHSRAESITQDKFDYVVSRAVAPLKDLWSWSWRNIKKTNDNVATADAHLYNGLICLKGGDLAQEIHESGLKPLVWDIAEIYEEDFFKEKYVLFIPRK
jgi:16S rRNA (guanine527-N7)-methyltransferase